MAMPVERKWPACADVRVDCGWAIERDWAVTNWLALHLQSIDRYRGKTQWNWSDDRRVDPALATGRCWSRSLCQRFLCIFIDSVITNAGRPKSHIPWLPNLGRVSPRLARTSMYVTASRKVRNTGLRAHSFFPKRRKSSAHADTTWRKKKHFDHWRMNFLAQSLRLLIFWTSLTRAKLLIFAPSLESRLPTAGNRRGVKWKNLGKTSNKRLSVTHMMPSNTK